MSNSSTLQNISLSIVASYCVLNVCSHQIMQFCWHHVMLSCTAILLLVVIEVVTVMTCADNTVSMSVYPITVY